MLGSALSKDFYWGYDIWIIQKMLVEMFSIVKDDKTILFVLIILEIV